MRSPMPMPGSVPPLKALAGMGGKRERSPPPSARRHLFASQFTKSAAQAGDWPPPGTARFYRSLLGWLLVVAAIRGAAAFALAGVLAFAAVVSGLATAFALAGVFARAVVLVRGFVSGERAR